MRSIKNDPPTPLEALRPITECETAELLRFLNFNTSLERWHSLKYRYEHSGVLSTEENYKQEMNLHVASISLLERIRIYDPYPPDGVYMRWDYDFMQLFPTTFPPMFDGTVYTWKSLVNELKRIASITLTQVKKAHEQNKRRAEEAEKVRSHSSFTFTH